MQAQVQSLPHAVIAFKPQEKSNAKRFLVKTSKVAPDDVPLYLTQVDGQWGTYITESGEPIKLAKVEMAISLAVHQELDAHIEAAQQAAAEARVNAPAIMTTADAPVIEDHDEHEEPASTSGFNVFASMFAPVAPPAGQAGTVVRDGKVVDPESTTEERADKSVQPGDNCPLCDADASNYVEATPGVSCLCRACGKHFSLATGREVRAGYKREDVNRGYKIEPNRAVQNNVKRPSTGTLCGQVWATLDAIYEGGMMPVARDLQNIATSLSINSTTVSCQFYAWRKFNGIAGRQVRA